MLYKVYQKGKPASEFDLPSTLFFAQDEVPVRAQIKFANGELIGIRNNTDVTVGLSTLWDVDKAGKLVIQTTRLPERTKPFNLAVELARGKLLRLNQKREEWQMCNLALTGQQHDMLDSSLDSFIEALCHLDEPEAASALAGKALSQAVEVGEAMALSHAEMFLEKRFESQRLGKHAFGCTIDMAQFNNKKYLEYIKDNFNFVTIPVSWRQIEPKEQERCFGELDNWVKWLSDNKIAIKVGPLVRFSPTAIPDWLYIWENDFEQVRDMAYDFVGAMVERYNGKVQAWEVCSGLNAVNSFNFSFEQLLDMTRTVSMAAKRAASRALILVEVTEPWGEYYSRNPRTIPPHVYLDMICQGSMAFDGISVRMAFGRGGGGMQCRDLLEISSMLDKLGIYGKIIHLTGVQVPSLPDSRDNSEAMGASGYWHEPWSLDIQAQWLENFYKIALSKPFVDTITWQDLADRKDGIISNGGLTSTEMHPKPAFDKLVYLKQLWTV
ncbi:MAG: endo-1,4-beta-xylanase [Sedimentisphaerales bacterium]|nr:endo-1,4-beta-xylanase [Sedimentisphaerales bacterium]MBN2842931.1 endo-1,4-beta-xylanase [Sedimentisphaerales bacterium]